MPSQIGTNARQAAGVQKVRSLCLKVVEALDELANLKRARDNGQFGLDPSNNPADPSSFLDATAVKLGYNDATLCRDEIYAALDAANTFYNDGNYQAILFATGYYEQTEG